MAAEKWAENVTNTQDLITPILQFGGATAHPYAHVHTSLVH